MEWVSYNCSVIVARSRIIQVNTQLCAWLDGNRHRVADNYLQLMPSVVSQPRHKLLVTLFHLEGQSHLTPYCKMENEPCYERTAKGVRHHRNEIHNNLNEHQGCQKGSLT